MHTEFESSNVRDVVAAERMKMCGLHSCGSEQARTFWIHKRRGIS
jgi:hypothetical protein